MFNIFTIVAFITKIASGFFIFIQAVSRSLHPAGKLAELSFCILGFDLGMLNTRTFCKIMDN